MVELFRSRLRRELDIMVGFAGGNGPERKSMESDCLSNMSGSNIQHDLQWTPIIPWKSASK